MENFLVGCLGALAFELIRLYRIITLDTKDTTRNNKKELFSENKNKFKIYFIIIPLLIIVTGLIVYILEPNSKKIALATGFFIPSGSWQIFNLIKNFNSTLEKPKVESTEQKHFRLSIFTLFIKYFLS